MVGRENVHEAQAANANFSRLVRRAAYVIHLLVQRQLSLPFDLTGLHHAFIMLRISTHCLHLPPTARPWLAVASIRRFASGKSRTNAREEDLQAARKWLDQLHADTIPKSIGELTFSRSSGPGGQNVNKYAFTMVAQTAAKYVQE